MYPVSALSTLVGSYRRLDYPKNHDVSLARSLKILAFAGPQRTFRLSVVAPNFGAAFYSVVSRDGVIELCSETATYLSKYFQYIETFCLRQQK